MKIEDILNKKNLKKIEAFLLLIGFKIGATRIIPYPCIRLSHRRPT